jgi:hypothetical protein
VTGERPATVLAFDFGTRRIGVAVGTTITRSARPLTTIDAPDRRHAHRGAGSPDRRNGSRSCSSSDFPCTPDGTPHAMTDRARRFGERLRERFAIPRRIRGRALHFGAREDRTRGPRTRRPADARRGGGANHPASMAR